MYLLDQYMINSSLHTEARRVGNTVTTTGRVSHCNFVLNWGFHIQISIWTPVINQELVWYMCMCNTLVFHLLRPLFKRMCCLWLLWSYVVDPKCTSLSFLLFILFLFGSLWSLGSSVVSQHVWRSQVVLDGIAFLHRRSMLLARPMVASVNIHYARFTAGH